MRTETDADVRREPDSPSAPGSTPPAGSFGRSLKSIGWAFVGIRRSSGHQQDTARINPLHLIAVALVVVFALVAGLMAFVHWVVPG